MPENDTTPVTEAQQEAAQASDAKAEATSTAKASDELSEDDLAAMAGGSGDNLRMKPKTSLAPDSTGNI